MTHKKAENCITRNIYASNDRTPRCHRLLLGDVK